MDYKLSESILKLREYGRNVQMLVEEARKMEDPEMRQSLVEEIIQIMKAVNPSVKDNPEHEQKLWDHLFLLADFDLNVDSPYPVPKREEILPTPPERAEYVNSKPKIRQYGKNVDLLMEKAMEMEPGEEQDALVNLIANIMNLQLQSHQRDSHAEATVLEHIKKLSGGKFEPNPDEMHWYKVPPPPSNNSNKRSGGKKRKKKRRRKNK